MEPGIVLIAYFSAWLGMGLFCMVYCKFREDSRIVFTPLSLIIRLTRSLSFLDRVKGTRFAKLIAATGILFLIYSGYQYYQITIASIIARFFTATGKNIPPPFAPLVPGLTVSLETFLLLLPGLSVAVIVHELAHAVAAKAEGLEIKSAGIVVFLAFIFGAFVEIDENKLRKAPLLSRLSVYSAGVAANTVTALLILYALILPLMSMPTGLLIVDIVPNSTAAKAGLHKYDVIVSVNGTPVHSFNDLSRILSSGAEKYPEKQTYVIEVIRGKSRVSITVLRNDSQKIGVLIGPIPLTLVESLGAGGAYYFYQIIFYTFMLNYVLAVINAAPLFITDGAKALDSVLERLGDRRGLVVSKVFQVVTLLLLLANLNLGLVS